MALFKDMLGSGQTLFKDVNALDFEYVPKNLPFRDGQHQHIAACIRPLLQERPGRNLFIHGPPGIGKTAAVKWVFRDLEWDTEEVIPIYVNCWQKNTTYKILVEICDIIGYKFTQNKKTEQLFEVVKEILNKKGVVFAFDEVDKLEEMNFLYIMLEEVYNKSILLITNYRDWLFELEPRIKSRLTPEVLEFKPYSYKETEEVLKERIRYAFFPGVFDQQAFDIIVKETFNAGDIRSGIYMLKESAMAAEDSSSKKVILEHARYAVKKLEDFTIKDPSQLDEDSRNVLSVIKISPGKKIGDLHKLYKEAGGSSTYKTFQRKIAKLEQNKFITVEKQTGGTDGTTTIINPKEQQKKLS